MKICDNAVEVAFAIVLVIVAITVCIIAYNASKQPSNLDLLTKYILQKDSILTANKLDSLATNSKELLKVIGE